MYKKVLWEPQHISFFVNISKCKFCVIFDTHYEYSIATSPTGTVKYLEIGLSWSEFGFSFISVKHVDTVMVLKIFDTEMNIPFHQIKLLSH